MAGDWIKMRTSLYRNPKVCVIADLLMDGAGPLARYVNQNCQCNMAVTRNVTRNATVGALVTVWGTMRHAGKRIGDDLVIRGASRSVVDDIAELPGFGDAMAEVGWLVETGNGIRFPRFFEELNVEPDAGQPSKGAIRQRKYRERKTVTPVTSPTVTGDVTVTDREEKRRVEKNTEPPLPPKGGTVTRSDDGFERFWGAYPRRVARTGAEKAFAKLAPGPELLETILAAVQAQQRPGGALENRTAADGRSVVPHPASWLNGRRWEDEPPTMTGPPRPPLRDRTTQYAIDTLMDLFEDTAHEHPPVAPGPRVVDAAPALPGSDSGMGG